MRLKGGCVRRTDDDLTTAQPLAHIIVRFPYEINPDALHEKGAEALARAAGEVELDRAVRKSLAAVGACHLA